ncbi:MAG TPA: T9SS type A sorting domain-containing protein [Flavipsychrobacter sp.]|nr:T9SS type A sorting domain-containing protein [Flavipsychrobacter sp.]
MKKALLSSIFTLVAFVSFANWLGQFPGTNACYSYNAQTGKTTLKVNYEAHDWTHVQAAGPPTSRSWVYVKDPSNPGYLGPFSAISYNPAANSAEYDISAIISAVNFTNCIEWFVLTDFTAIRGTTLPPPPGSVFPPTPAGCVTSSPLYVPAYNACWDYSGITWSACLCAESDLPPACNSNFNVSINHSSVPTFFGLQTSVTTELEEFHPASTYLIDWGDGTTSPTPQSHVYTPGPSSGTYTICVTETMANGCECATCVQFCLPVTTALGLPWSGSGPCTPERKQNRNPDGMKKTEREADARSKKAVEINPNPAENNAEILFQLSDKASVSIKVIDATGKLVYSSNEQTYDAGSQKAVLNTSKYPSGLYMIQVKMGNETIIKKLLVTH